MKYLIYYDIKRNFPLRRILLAIIVAWLAIFFFSHFFANDMTEDRLLEKLSVGIIDQDKSKLSNMLLANFKQNKQFSSMMDLEIGSYEKLHNKFEKGNLTAIVTIPKGFTDGLMHYQNLPLSILISDKKPLKAIILTEVLDSYSDYIQSVDAATLSAYEILSKTNISKQKLKKHNDLFSIQMVTFALNRNKFFSYEKIATFPTTNSFIYFISAILCLVICILSTGIIFTLYDDVKSFTIHRYKMHSSNFYKYIASKLLSFAIAISLICIFISLPLFIYIAMTFKQVFIITTELFVFSLMYISVLLFIGLVLFSETSASLFCNLFVFVLGLIGGNFIPLSLMPKTIQNISSFTLNYQVIKILIQSISDGDLTKTNYIFMIICLISIAILYISSCKLIKFKIEEDGGKLCETLS